MSMTRQIHYLNSLLLCLVISEPSYAQSERPVLSGSRIRLSSEAVNPITKGGALSVVSDNVGPFWSILRAELLQNFLNTWTTLELRNESDSSVERAIFYVEYFDEKDRFCFSSAFSLDENSDGLHTSMAPGDIRKLQSLSVGFGTAIPPTRAKVYLLEQRGSDGKSINHEGDVRMHIPVTIPGGIATQWSRIHYSPRVSNQTPALQDLILAEVRVSNAGRLTNVNILKAVTPDIESWFQNWIHQISFIPAGNEGIPVTAGAAVLVRAVNFEQSGQFRKMAFSVPESEFIRAYGASLSDSGVVSVNQLIFALSTQKDAAKPGDMIWEYYSPGTEWSANVYTWLTDPATGRCCTKGFKRPNEAQ